MKLAFVGHSHHVVTRSSGFFLDALRTRWTVEVRWCDGWQTGRHLDPSPLLDARHDAIVVWQVEEAALALARARHPNVTFFPMYDSCHAYPDSFWRQLGGIKIACFSGALHARLVRLGLRTRRAQYFPAPAPAAIAQPRAGLAGYLWQRGPDVTWTTVRALLGDAPVERFTLHEAPDPGVACAAAPAPDDVVRYRIRTTRWFATRAEAQAALAGHDVYFAPRAREGIGLSVLEAMAMGLLVVAPARPTHDEYVVSGVNGLLYEPDRPAPLDFSNRRALGARAREAVARGHERWLRTLPALLDLVEVRPAEVPPGGAWSSLDPEHGAVRAVARPQWRAKGSQRVAVIVARGAGGPALDETLRSVAAQDAPARAHVVDAHTAPALAPLLRALDAAEHVLLLRAGDRIPAGDALSSALRDAPAGADVLYGHHLGRDPRGDEELVRATELHEACARLRRGELAPDLLAAIPAPGAVLWRAALLRDLPPRPELPRLSHFARLCEAAARGLAAHHTLSALCSSPRAHESVRERLGILAEWSALADELSDDPARAARALTELRRRVWGTELSRLSTRDLVLGGWRAPGAARELRRRLRAERQRWAARRLG